MGAQQAQLPGVDSVLGLSHIIVYQPSGRSVSASKIQGACQSLPEPVGKSWHSSQKWLKLNGFDQPGWVTFGKFWTPSSPVPDPVLEGREPKTSQSILSGVNCPWNLIGYRFDMTEKITPKIFEIPSRLKIFGVLNIEMYEVEIRFAYCEIKFSSTKCFLLAKIISIKKTTGKH